MGPAGLEPAPAPVTAPRVHRAAAPNAPAGAFLLGLSRQQHPDPVRVFHKFFQQLVDDIQTTAIVQMQLGRLTGLERDKILDDLNALKIKIAELGNDAGIIGAGLLGQ